jgi:hypothetical protein
MRRFKPIRRPSTLAQLPAGPKPLSAGLRDALDALADTLDPALGVAVPLDLLAVVDAMDRCFDDGDGGHPELVTRYLVERQGWDGPAARHLAVIWETVIALRNLRQITGRDGSRARSSRLLDE